MFSIADGSTIRVQESNAYQVETSECTLLGSMIVVGVRTEYKNGYGICHRAFGIDLIRHYVAMVC